MSEEERAEAIALLEDERLLERLLDDLDRLGCVGEEENKLALYLSMTSRLLPHPISNTVKGESAGGKSFTVALVAKMFPADEVRQVTALSAHALFHIKDEMAHKVLIVYERPGAEESDYPLRTLLSEGRLIYLVSVKNPETGQWTAQEVEVEGPVSLIETTTEAHLHEENETRCFDLHVDESEEQTRRIVKRQRLAHVQAPVDEDEITRPWRNAQCLLEPLPVRIPFADLIEFPTDRIRARRDQVRFLALIEASALLHQRQRERVTIGGQEYVVATLADYAVGHALAKKLLKQTVRGYTPKCEELVRKAWPQASERMSAEEIAVLPALGRAEIQKRTRWCKKTVEKFAEEAEDAGLIEILRPGRGKPNEYRLVSFPGETTVRLLSPEEIHDRWTREPGHDLGRT